MPFMTHPPVVRPLMMVDLFTTDCAPTSFGQILPNWPSRFLTDAKTPRANELVRGLDELNVCSWPKAGPHYFPKIDVRAASIGRSSRSASMSKKGQHLPFTAIARVAKLG